MKMPILVFFTLLACSAGAQQQGDESLEAKAARRQREAPPAIREEKPNEITTIHLTYSGIVVEVVKMKNPLELINPAAPAEYGWAENNVVWDPIDRKVSGLKLFSIDF